jgi:copper transport protein
VRITLPPDLRRGTYVVTWHVISADSHPVVGSSIFHVGAPSSTTAPPTIHAPHGVTPVRTIGTAGIYGAALVAIGAGWFGHRWGSGRVDRLATRTSLAGLDIVVAVFVVRVVELEGSWNALGDIGAFGRVLDGPIGLSSLLLVVALMVVAAAPALGRAHRAIWAVGAGLVVAGFLAEGHTRSASPRWLLWGADALHMAAGSIWLGGLAALAVCWRTASGPERRTNALDVSAHAIWAVAGVTAGGVAMAIAIAPDARSLVTTRWGAVIITKVVLVAALVGFGWFNRSRVLPRLDRAPHDAERAAAVLRRTLRAELALFVVLLVATATLVASSPSSATAAPVSTPVSATEPLGSGTGTVRFELSPGARGYNDLYLTISDAKGEPLELIWDPTVEIDAPDLGIGPIQLVAHALGDGLYHVPVEIPLAGAWRFTVDARTGTFESGTATITTTID